jgi:hypothetical protein
VDLVPECERHALAAKHCYFHIIRAFWKVWSIIGHPDRADPRTDRWYLGQNDFAPDYVTLVATYDGSDIVTLTNFENT